MEPHEVSHNDKGATPRSSCSGGREITLETLVHATGLTVGKNESLTHFLKRVTHLTLNGDALATGKTAGNNSSTISSSSNRGKAIRRIQNLHYCPNLKVLYLYDNEIEEVGSLDADAPQLSHLYLQNNRIGAMQGLESLRQLEKLYLSGNRIARLEGLAGGSTMLQELHLSNQSLPPDVTFSFDPDSLYTIARSLRVLTLANSRVSDVRPLVLLRGLEVLDLSRNLIDTLEDVFELLGGLPGLVELDLRQNTVTNAQKYRERVITFSSARLKLLDGKDVDANQRRMMQSHMAHKFRKHQETTTKASPQSAGTAEGEIAESRRMIKHGTATHQLRSMHLASTGFNKQSSGKSLLASGLGIAGASCTPASSAALVRTHSCSNNARND